MISMNIADPVVGKIDLSGSMTKQTSKDWEVSKANTQIMNMGKMLEEMELRIRNNIEGIYIQKTREVINSMRSTAGTRENQWAAITQSLNDAVTSHAAKRGGSSV